jgi:manganese oxidase
VKVAPYYVVALPMTIYYNREGDHDHNGMLYALEANVPILKYIEALARQGSRRRPGVQAPDPQSLFAAAAQRAQDIKVHLPLTPSRQDGHIRWYVRWRCGHD